ncbi:probable carboxylesterase 17 [Nymphaea colorata]|uniref:Alpha/beta hydrolase fold-3 domain-containing protein n=1 Tax=Nymphaea colorata TaxID=210225 RepID=A0A5K1FPD2_9MAGN|nr:probable carboxylesterase 17 [Nymphaea colorata]
MAPKQVELEAKKLRVYTDGTVDRAPQPVANASPTTVDGVASKDVVINLKNGVTGRLYKPQVCDTLTSTKLPLLFYYHGGGFCTGSCSQVQTHNFLHSLCLKTRTLVIAVDYRLSPEHRLPAQYDDCMDALYWAAKGGDGDWVAKYGNLAECFLYGESSGGTIAHHVGVRVAGMSAEARPPRLAVRGLVLVQPFFGSAERTAHEESYARQGSQQELLARWYDLFWKLSLPQGADKSSPYCNPKAHLSSLPSPVNGPPVLVTLAGLDLLLDRGLWYAELARTHMKSKVEVMVEEGQDHNYHVNQPTSIQKNRLLTRISQFINSQSSR